MTLAAKLRRQARDLAVVEKFAAWCQHGHSLSNTESTRRSTDKADITDRATDHPTVVCGATNSPSSPGLVRSARTVARARNGRVALVHAHEPMAPLPAALGSPAGSIPPDPDLLDDAARSADWDLLGGLQPLAGADAIVRVQAGRAAEALSGCARWCRAEMMVINAPGHARLTACLIGSTAAGLLKRPPCRSC